MRESQCVGRAKNVSTLLWEIINNYNDINNTYVLYKNKNNSTNGKDSRVTFTPVEH